MTRLPHLSPSVVAHGCAVSRVPFGFVLHVARSPFGFLDMVLPSSLSLFSPGQGRGRIFPGLTESLRGEN